MKKERLDRLLVDRGLVAGRNKAFAVILAGQVKVNGEVCLKPDFAVDSSARVDYHPTELSYVSRGGLKLEKALDVFGVDVSGLIALDAGSSTGGFTDCLLRRGASRVIAVDVGYGQLDWRLRNDERVELHERVNLRYLTPEMISGPADIATLDLSFISLTKVMPAVTRCLAPDANVLALVKPQFEAGKGRVGRGGVVRDPAVRLSVLTELSRRLIDEGLSVLGMTWSPILGAKGNVEYWFYLSKESSVGYSIQRVEELAAELVHNKLT
jgi:23S rRNA (cytidine1920-2'-O)/16S rRNA (cytidine1409-2'-O)-methyltransferase